MTTPSTKSLLLFTKKCTLKNYLKHLYIKKNDSITNITEIFYELLNRINYKYFTHSKHILNINEVKNILHASLIMNTYLEICNYNNYSNENLRKRLRKICKLNLNLWLTNVFTDILEKRPIQYYSEKILSTRNGEQHLNIIKFYFKEYLNKSEFKLCILNLHKRLRETNYQNNYLNLISLHQTNNNNINNIFKIKNSQLNSNEIYLLLEKILNLHKSESIRMAIYRLINFSDLNFKFEHFMLILLIPCNNYFYKISQIIFNEFLKEIHCNDNNYKYYNIIVKQLLTILQTDEKINLFLKCIQLFLPFYNAIIKLLKIYFQLIEHKFLQENYSQTQCSNDADDDEEERQIQIKNDNEQRQRYDNDNKFIWYTILDNNEIIHLNQIVPICCLLASSKSSVQIEFYKSIKEEIQLSNELYKMVFNNYCSYNF